MGGVDRRPHRRPGPSPTSALLGALVLLALLGWLLLRAATGPARVVVGVVLLVALAVLGARYLRARRAVAAEAPLPRSGAGERPVLAWDEGDDDCELVDPAPELVRECVARLDGRTRTTVSVLRGAGRLDVGGDAAAAVVVFCSDDRRAWHQVVTPHAGSGEAAVTVGRTAGRYPLTEVTTVAEAQVAAATWLASGVRDAGLAWLPADRRREVVRPPSLEADDAR